MNHNTYWLFRFKKSWPYSLAILIIYLIASIGVIASYHPTYSFSPVYLLNNFGSTLIGMGFFIAVIMGIVPRNKYYSKRSVDIYAALPLERKGVFWIDCLFGFAQVYLPWVAAFFLGILFFPVATQGTWVAFPQAGYLFLFGLLATLEGWLLSYSLATYANNLLDSFLLIGLGVAFPYVVSLFTGTFPIINKHLTLSATDFWPSQMPFTEDFQLIDGYRSYQNYYATNHALTPWFCYFIQGVICLILLASAYFHFQAWKAENAGEQSKGIWGYPTWLSAFFFIFFAALAATTSGGYFGYWVPLLLGIIVAYLICLCIFQRKIKISKASLITALIVVASGTVTGFILTYFSYPPEA